MTSSTVLFQASQIRQCRQMAAKAGLTDVEFLARAAQAAANQLQQHFPTARNIIVYCGSGDSAGVGYTLANKLHLTGLSVLISQDDSLKSLSLATQHAAMIAVAAGISCQCLSDDIPDDIDLIVDALALGRATDDMTMSTSAAIEQINASDLPVLSLDIPAGLDANSGHIAKVCVKADVTVTFMTKKTGMMTLNGPDYCGHIICDDLNMGAFIAGISPPVRILENQLSILLPKRLKQSHKNDFGHVLIVGGGAGMPGAVCLAAMAALRIGAGVVSIATRPEHAHLLANLPEAMVYGVNQPEDILSLIDRASVCVIGPGLGTDDWAFGLYQAVITSQLPMIIDASALRMLAQTPQQDDNWVLTPHPGEAADLLNCSIADIQANRFQAVTLLQEKYGGNVILKGVGTLIRSAQPLTWLCDAGNPGMATAGMGDVLSGVIAGIIAQKISLAEAAKMGVWLHAKAADLAVDAVGERGLLASDLMPYLRLLVNSKVF